MVHCSTLCAHLFSLFFAVKRGFTCRSSKNVVLTSFCASLFISRKSLQIEIFVTKLNSEEFLNNEQPFSPLIWSNPHMLVFSQQPQVFVVALHIMKRCFKSINGALGANDEYIGIIGSHWCFEMLEKYSDLLIVTIWFEDRIKEGIIRFVVQNFQIFAHTYFVALFWIKGMTISASHTCLHGILTTRVTFVASPELFQWQCSTCVFAPLHILQVAVMGVANNTALHLTYRQIIKPVIASKQSTSSAVACTGPAPGIFVHWAGDWTWLHVPSRRSHCTAQATETSQHSQVSAFSRPCA